MQRALAPALIDLLVARSSDHIPGKRRSKTAIHLPSGDQSGSETPVEMLVELPGFATAAEMT